MLFICRMTTLLQNRMWAPWLWWDPLYNLMDDGKESARRLATLHGFTRRVIADRLAQSKVNQEHDGKRKRKAFLDMLLNEYEANQLTIEGIREEVDTFMFEGDTIILGITLSVWCSKPVVYLMDSRTLCLFKLVNQWSLQWLNRNNPLTRVAGPRTKLVNATDWIKMLLVTWKRVSIVQTSELC